MKTKRENQAVLREYTEKRDHGVCALCGVDTEQLKRDLWPPMPSASFDFCSWTYKTDEKALGIVKEWRESLTWFTAHLDEFERLIRGRGQLLLRHPWAKKLKRWDHWWEADHIIPLSEGGANTLDNIRTLCLGCHKGATKELAARRARNPKKTYNTFD